MSLRRALSEWWGQDPPYVREAKAAWDRGDAVFVHRYMADIATSATPAAARILGARCSSIARVGWRLQHVEHVSRHAALATFVR